MAISKKDFYKGQKLFLKPLDSRDKETVATVFSVGRKWVCLGRDNAELRIDLSEEVFLDKRFYGLKNYGVRGMFFFSEQELKDYEEFEEKKDQIIKKVKLSNFIPLEKVNKILELLEDK